jgi:translation initiation factor IF-3
MLYFGSVKPANNWLGMEGRIPRDYRINQRIRVPRVLVIDEEGEQLGDMPTEDAITLAQDKGLDLVEVAPAADPPVCRLLDYGKFKYLQTKKEREARKGQKITLLREVRFRPSIGIHDIEAKKRQVKKLLAEGSKVKLTVMFRGREITHQDLGVNLLRKMAESFKDEAKLEKAPSMEGRRMSVTIVPSGQKVKSDTESEEEISNA